MEQKIKEVQEYFISKILNEEFIVGNISEYTTELIIDEKYCFPIWMCNDPINRKPYMQDGRCFMDLQITDKQAVKINSILEERYSKYSKEVLLKEKRKQLARLKKELGE